MLGLAELIGPTVRPYAANDDQVLAAGPDLELEPPMAFALHLVFHELATNAKKYGALSSPFGRVKIEWKLRHVADVPRKLAVVWTEQGGPEVKAPHYRGFGSRLIRTALEAYGGVRLDFDSTGLACFMLIDLDRTDARIEVPARQRRGVDRLPCRARQLMALTGSLRERLQYRLVEASRALQQIFIAF
jgi:two-component sensor histidine kinase